MPALRIIARDPASRARAGVAATPRTARSARPRSCRSRRAAACAALGADEVAALGYDIVLGNTFHLFLRPGGELIERFGGLHRFMGWGRAIITDSGGFQVFSMGHGTVADEIKGAARRRRAASGAILAIEEEGVRFRSYLDGSRALPRARRSRWPSRRSCTPTSCWRSTSARRSTSTATTRRARPSGPTAGSSAAIALARRSTAAPPSLFYGIVQGGVYEDLRDRVGRGVVASGADGDRDRRLARPGEGADVRGRRLERRASSSGVAPERPRHLLGIGEIDDLIRGVELGIDSFDCAMPTRLARHGVALVADPANRWRLAVDRPAWRADDGAADRRLPVPGVLPAGSRAPTCTTCARSRELTGARLLTLAQPRRSSRA